MELGKNYILGKSLHLSKFNSLLLLMSDSKKLLRPFVLYFNLKKGKIKSTK